MCVCVCVCLCLSVSCFSSCLSLIVQEKEAAKKLKAQTKAKGKGRGRGRGQGRGRQKGRGKGRSRHAQVSAVQLPQVQESDSEVEKGDAVDEEMQAPAAGEVTAVDEEMQAPDVALPTGVLPPATPVSTTEATSTSVVPAMDAEQQLSAEPLLATENPVAEDLLAAGPSNVPSTTEGIEPDPSTSVSPPHAAAPVVPEEPAAPVVPEEPAAPVVPEEPAGPVVPEEPAGPVVPASALPSGAPRFVSAKEHQTPAIMQRLAPPFCTFALDFKAHRFSFKYGKAPSPNVWTEQDALLMISSQKWLVSLTTYLQLSPTQGQQVPECWPKFQMSEFCHVSELGQSDTCCFTRFKIQMLPLIV